MTTLLVAALAIGGWWLVDWFDGRRVTIAFDHGAEAMPALELTFYPEQFAFTSPSPPPAIGSLQLGGAASVTVGSELVPSRGVVRYRGEGVGAGVVHVRLGEDPAPIRLGASGTIRGRVGEPVCAWWCGWRTLAFRAVPGAQVVMMGGGEHGVELATTTTDGDGRFTIEGFDEQRSALGLRVLADGFGIQHRHIEELRGDAGALVPVLRAPPRRGRLSMGVDVDPTSLRVLVRNLPGVEAVPAADGTFTLDHVPHDVEARIVLFGLPGTCAYPAARTDRARVVDIEVVPAAIVRGTVVDARTGREVVGALVWVDDGDAVKTGDGGVFELPGVLPGVHRLTAQWNVGRRSPPRLGRRDVELAPGGVYDDIEINID